jgi:hypothetical protein
MPALPRLSSSSTLTLNFSRTPTLRKAAKPSPSARPPTKDRSRQIHRRPPPGCPKDSKTVDPQVLYGSIGSNGTTRPPSCTRFECLKLSTMIFGGLPALGSHIRPPRCTEWPFSETYPPHSSWAMTTLRGTPDAARLQSNRENVRETSKRNSRTMREILELPQQN